MEKPLDALKKLHDVVTRLRAPGGCPWDREQTLSDMGRYILEEASEVVDAIEDDGGRASTHVCEELGDLLMNIFLAASIAAEEGAFTLGDVAEGIRDKLVRRHPHVFGDAKVSGVDEVLERWNEIKAEENRRRDDARNAGTPASPPSRLDGVPRSLPPLNRAYKVSRHAARCGFDWPGADGAMAKLQEEIDEVRALLEQSPEHPGLEEELGDVLFSVVNVCRKVGVDPDGALRATLRKFTRRFQAIEERIDSLEEATLDEMQSVWDEVKREGA